MPSDDLVRDFIKETRGTLKEIQKDVKELMKFRWMVMGGAVVSSFIFTVVFEIAKAMAERK